MTSNITPENYIFKFGKFQNMKAIDVSNIRKVNPKTGVDERVGLKYLHFLVEKCDWFRDTDIIKQIIDMVEKNISDVNDEKETKKEKKKEKKEKTVKIECDTVSKTLNFEK